MASIIVEATQRHIVISGELGEIIARHLGITATELKRIERFVKNEMATLLVRLARIEQEKERGLL